MNQPSVKPRKGNLKRMSFPNANNNEMGVLAPFMGTGTDCGSNNSNNFNLDTASKFGPVVKSFKKPGHHIPGPARNPHCPCHHCRHYFESQDTLQDIFDKRSRAFSMSHADRLSQLSNSSRTRTPDNYFNSSSYDSLNMI